MELKQLVCNSMVDKQFYEYRGHWSRVSFTIMTIYNTMIDNDKFIKSFKNRTVTQIRNNLDFLSVYREADKVNQLL
jgi:hypothetical protein